MKKTQIQIAIDQIDAEIGLLKATRDRLLAIKVAQPKRKPRLKAAPMPTERGA